MEAFMKNETPVTALRSSSIAILGMLKEPGTIHESSGLLNNYEGFAELAGFNSDKIALLKNTDNPMKELLKIWADICAAQRKQVPTIGNLWEFLIHLGRPDVTEKLEQSVRLDVKAYKNTPTEPIGYEEEEMKSICLTRNGEQQFYDGYVGSDENDDSRALKITLFLEQALNLTLFLTSRDMPPGVALYPAQAYIIEKRCRYLLCFITKDFDRSPSCQFIVRYVNHLAPDSEGKKKKIIPMIIDSQAKVPNIMQPLMHVDFSNSEVEQYSQHKHWNQLKESLLELEDYSEASRKLKKSMSVQPINFVKPQTYRRSISEQTDQSKRSVSVCRFGIGQEETKNEVYKIVRTPSDDSQAECGELSQATGGPNPIDSSLCTGVHEIDIQSVVRFRIRRETEV